MNLVSNIGQMLLAPLKMLVMAPLKLVGAPRRLMSLSLPMRVAVFVAIFMLFLAIVSLVMFLSVEEAAGLWNFLTGTRTIATLVFMVLSPIIAYHTTRLWLEKDLSRFPDIDAAWQEGLKALAEQQIDLEEIPIYLVLGAPHEQIADNMMQASGLDLLVRSTPTGRAPLRWYANDRLAYLFCLGTSCLSRLNQGVPSAARGGGGGPSITGTLVAGASSNSRDSGPSDGAGWGNAAGGREIRGTLVAGGIQGTLSPGSVTAAPSRGGSEGPRALTRQEMEEMTERISYVCQLLRRTRQPLCPLNGIVTLLPFPVVQDILVAKDMPEAIRRDLKTIRETAQLSCPVTAVVTGMEAEPGFSELVRRVGTSRAKNSRFGKGFHVRNSPDGENLEALASEACGSFEDWVYTLFREEDGLNKLGNGKLYALLCTIRSQLQQRLRNILLRGFSSDPADGGNESEPELFSGCYFAATGDTPDRQAFVRSVLEKVSQLEEELEWTEDALVENDRYGRWATTGMVVNGLLLVAIVSLAVYFWGYAS